MNFSISPPLLCIVLLWFLISVCSMLNRMDGYSDFPILSRDMTVIDVITWLLLIPGMVIVGVPALCMMAIIYPMVKLFSNDRVINNLEKIAHYKPFKRGGE